MSKKEDQDTIRKSIIGWIRAAAKETGGKPPALRRCLAQLKIPQSQLYKLFNGWNAALREAGIDFELRGERIEPGNLLADWGRVARKLGQIPMRAAYDVHGKHASGTFRARFGSWTNMPSAFRKFADGRNEWSDVLALCDTAPRRGRRSRPDNSPRRNPGGARLIRGRTIFGGPLQLPGLATAPVNEAGVLYLFGIIGWRLGFQVESVRPFFPDCEARRDMGSGRWQRVTIEFEYESRNFARHAHPPGDCDLIVCWRHNWPDCPKNLEVIALSDELQRLSTFNSIAPAAAGRGGCPQPPAP